MTDVTCTEMLCKVEAWCIIFSFFCAASALIVVNNIAQLAGALSNRHANLLIIFIGIANALGRMGFGYISDKMKGVVARPLFLALVLGVMSLGHLQLAFAGADTMMVGMMVVVLGFGGSWALVPTLVSEIFGFTHFGANYQMVALGPAAGGFAMSVGLASYIYDEYADPVTLECLGGECFHNTLLVASGVAAAGCLASVLLWVRTRAFFNNKHAAVVQVGEEGVAWNDDLEVDPAVFI